MMSVGVCVAYSDAGSRAWKMKSTGGDSIYIWLRDVHARTVAFESRKAYIWDVSGDLVRTYIHHHVGCH